jgi:chromosome segregation ATPase
MDVSVIISIVSLLGVFATAVFSFLQTKSNNGKDVLVSDRQTAKEIREELRSEIKQLRDEVAMWRVRSLELEDQLREWKDKYAELEIDYLKALSRIAELEKRVAEGREGSNAHGTHA